MLAENLVISAAMVVLTVCIHFFGLAGLIALMRAEFAAKWREGSAFERGGMILLTVLALFGLHGVEVWSYAVLFIGLGEFTDFETALYFSTTSFGTLGFGDVIVHHNRRMIGAIEGLNGFLLIGWSTAFLVSVTAKMGLLEAQLERGSRHSDPNRPNLP